MNRAKRLDLYAREYEEANAELKALEQQFHKELGRIDMVKRRLSFLNSRIIEEVVYGDG